MKQVPELPLQKPLTVDLVAQINAYEAAHNAYEVTAVRALFAEDAVFELVGQGILPNLEAILGIHEYDKAIHAQIQFQNCIIEDCQLTCEVVEHNEWLKFAGLREIFYPSSIFTFTSSGKIQKIAATISAKDGAAMGAILAEFIPWIMVTQPQAASYLFSPSGEFIYSGANGALMLELLAQWQALTKPNIGEEFLDAD
jgi:hypothetical protein